MGWLREHSALKITPIRKRSEGPFDEVPVDDLLHDHEQSEWKRWQQRLGALSQEIAAQAAQEMQERDQVPRKRGRPSALASYKNYKRFYLQEWAQFITAQALKMGMTQGELASLFNEAWDGANWRELLRADDRQYRMVYGANKVVKARGWDIRRNGNLTMIWTRALFNPKEFEEWALQSSPQFHHNECVKSC